MANMRYRKPSVKTILGVTKLKKRVKKALGINAVLAPFRAVNNYQRRMLRRAGYYNPEMKALRAAKKGKVAGPIGAIQVSEGEKGSGKGVDGSALMMAAMMSQGDHEKDEGVNPLLMGAMLAGGALGGEGKGHKKGDDGPGLAEAMLLATAMKGSGEKHEAKAKSAPRARRSAQEEDEPEEEHPRAAHSSRSKTKKEEEEPKRKKGFRLFG